MRNKNRWQLQMIFTPQIVVNISLIKNASISFGIRVFSVLKISVLKVSMPTGLLPGYNLMDLLLI